MTRDFDLLWNFGDPEATERVFREILASAETADSGYRAELRTQIARTLGLQKRFDEAMQILDEIEPQDDRVVARRELERGRVLNSKGDPEASRPHFLAALEHARAAGADYLAVDAVHMLAIVQPGQEGIAWARQGIEMAQRSTDERTRNWQGALLNNLGWTLHDLGLYGEALEVFEESERFRREAGAPGPWRIARYTVARAKRSLGRFEEALAESSRLRDEDPADPYFSEEVAENLLALGRPQEAARFFGEAYEGLKDDLWVSDAQKARLRELSDVVADE